MCNLAIFLGFGVTWIAIGGLIMFIALKRDGDYIKRDKNLTSPCHGSHGQQSDWSER